VVKGRKLEPKGYALTGYPGISGRQLEGHYSLYNGYVNKYREIAEILERTDYRAANQTYSELRALKLAENFAYNAIKLHEAYFENLGGGGEAASRLRKAVEEEFGSWEDFRQQFAACGLAARGWVILSWLPAEQRLTINCLDAHDAGFLAGSVPLLVMDVYEHAYFIDYGAKRAAYIEAFWNNIAWEEVNRRWERVEELAK